MMDYDHSEQGGAGESPQQPHEPIVLDVVAEPAEAPARVRVVRRRRRVLVPLLLFLATCVTTLMAGVFTALPQQLEQVATIRGWAYVFNHFQFDWTALLAEGLKYAVPVMVILACHEAGHFIQTRRYGVAASFPYFLPVPFPPLGTLGAVIVMDSRMRSRRALFDIGISGPLAGLVPTLIFCVLGLTWSHYAPGQDQYGDPLLLKWLAHWILGPQPAGYVIGVHPTAFAAWVGLLITALNLMPIGQLDGGHVLYSLLRTKAYPVAAALLFGGVAAVILSGY